MTASAPTASHRRGTVVTDRILVGALELMAERGTMAVSIEQIARHVGVDKTTVYRRWPDVDSLLLAALRRHAENAVPIEPTGDVRRDLIDLCRRVADNLESTLGRGLMIAGRRSEDLGELRRAFWDERLRAARTIIGSDTPTRIIEWLVGPIHFRIVERGGTFDDHEIEQLVDGVLLRLSAARPDG